MHVRCSRTHVYGLTYSKFTVKMKNKKCFVTFYQQSTSALVLSLEIHLSNEHFSVGIKHGDCVLCSETVRCCWLNKAELYEPKPPPRYCNCVRCALAVLEVPTSL